MGRSPASERGVSGLDVEAELTKIGKEKALFKAAMRLLDSTPGAKGAADVARIREREWFTLLAEESGIPRDEIDETSWLGLTYSGKTPANP